MSKPTFLPPSTRRELVTQAGQPAVVTNMTGCAGDTVISCQGSNHIGEQNPVEAGAGELVSIRDSKGEEERRGSKHGPDPNNNGDTCSVPNVTENQTNTQSTSEQELSPDNTDKVLGTTDKSEDGLPNNNNMNNIKKSYDKLSTVSSLSKSKTLYCLLDKIITNITDKNKSIKITKVKDTMNSSNSSEPDVEVSPAIESFGGSSNEMGRPRNDLSVSKQLGRNLDMSICKIKNTRGKVSSQFRTTKSKPPIKKARFQKMINPVVIRKQTDKKSKPKCSSETQTALLELQALRTDGTWVLCSRSECGKWRYLQEGDPSLVRINWECRDNTDKRYADCFVSEQKLDGQNTDLFVENKFTVGSLVWAKVLGWPRWPAMVDDDPDTGDFFWTEVNADHWATRPSHYHVVFFDSKEKGVSRAWVSERMLERLSGAMNRAGGKDKYGDRLRQAAEQAILAEEIDLVERRKKFCLATRFRGHWGPIWPGWSQSGVTYLKEREAERDPVSESDNDKNYKSNTIEDCARSLMPTEASQEVFSQMNDSYQNISLTYDNSIPGILEEGTPNRKLGGENNRPIAKKSRPNNSVDKENSPPSDSQQYYGEDTSTYTHDEDTSTYTQEKSVSPTSGGNVTQLSCSETADESNIDFTVNVVTPIKQGGLNMKTPRPSSLPHPSPLSTSTPLRQVRVCLPQAGDSPLISLHIPLLNDTAGSEAFSADGSVIDI